ncbi:MAG: helix-turn-helix transcriptional regulator [Dehalococcoidia bacterium]|nr:helix-turn-helix transcriptional regulator [Dehalococcoidia bacterium]
MVNHNLDMTLKRYAQEYANDPEFIAEGLSIKVVEEMLECLEKKGLNQSWLAQEMGVSRAHISRILNAPPNMTLLTIAKIAVALGLTLDVSLDAKSQYPTSTQKAQVTFAGLMSDYAAPPKIGELSLVTA